MFQKLYFPTTVKQLNVFDLDIRSSGGLTVFKNRVLNFTSPK